MNHKIRNLVLESVKAFCSEVFESKYICSYLKIKQKKKNAFYYNSTLLFKSTKVKTQFPVIPGYQLRGTLFIVHSFH